MALARYRADQLLTDRGCLLGRESRQVVAVAGREPELDLRPPGLSNRTNYLRTRTSVGLRCRVSPGLLSGDLPPEKVNLAAAGSRFDKLSDSSAPDAQAVLLPQEIGDTRVRDRRSATP